MLRVTLRVMSPVIVPTGRLATGADSAFHLAIAAVWSAAGATSRVTARLWETTEER